MSIYDFEVKDGEGNMVSLSEFEGKVYFGVGDFKPSYKQLKANPKFEISAVKNNGSEWLRLTAEAVFDERSWRYFMQTKLKHMLLISMGNMKNSIKKYKTHQGGIYNVKYL